MKFDIKGTCKHTTTAPIYIHLHGHYMSPIDVLRGMGSDLDITSISIYTHPIWSYRYLV